MARKKQQAEIPKENSYGINARNFIGMYTDIVVRGMVSLIVIFYPIYWIIMIKLEFPIWVYLPIVFLVAVLISPILNKYINVGFIVQRKYNDFLDKIEGK